MKQEIFKTESKQDTQEVASKLAASLHGGEVIIATGDLGAGKTAFCQGLGRALGVKGIINSPTFNLIKVYQGSTLTLYHVDCYRLENVDQERKNLGLEEVLGDHNIITYVEWPDYAPEYLKEYHPIIHIDIQYIDEERREITIQDERQ